jgi:hypothetical protein
VLDRLYAKVTADLAAMSTLVRQAIEQIPKFLDVRRPEAAVQLERCDVVERELVTALERGLITPEQYPTKEAEIRAQRASAQAFLQETDGYTFLAELWRRRQREPSRVHPEVARLLSEMPRGEFSPPTPNTARVWMPLPLVIAAMSVPERRRLLRAAIGSVALSPRDQLPVVISREGVAGYAELGKALGRSLAQGRGIPQPAIDFG